MFDLIYSDICGPYPKSLKNQLFKVSFIDDHTKFAKLYNSLKSSRNVLLTSVKGMSNLFVLIMELSTPVKHFVKLASMKAFDKNLLHLTFRSKTE